jgi:hypothetical protein
LRRRPALRALLSPAWRIEPNGRLSVRGDKRAIALLANGLSRSEKASKLGVTLDEMGAIV